MKLVEKDGGDNSDAVSVTEEEGWQQSTNQHDKEIHAH